MGELLVRLGSGAAGPVRLAVALALVAVPFVALSLLSPPVFEVDESFQPPGLGVAFVSAAVAVLVAAAVAGAVGGFFVRSRPTIGALLAFALAWPIAITLLPVAPAVLGVPFETAYSCFDTCGPMVHSDDPLTGGGAYLVSVFVSALTVVPLVILAICVFGAYKLNQGGAPFVATVLLGIGYISVHWLSILAGGPPLIGFLSLLLGVATWTWALRWRAEPLRLTPPAPPAA